MGSRAMRSNSLIPQTCVSDYQTLQPLDIHDSTISRLSWQRTTTAPLEYATLALTVQLDEFQLPRRSACACRPPTAKTETERLGGVKCKTTFPYIP
jgi:hypothetical protein